MEAALVPQGQVIIGTFAPDGPDRCSGLPVARYGAEGLAGELGAGFELVDQRRDDHVTPAGTVQKFQFCRFRRRAENRSTSIAGMWTWYYSTDRTKSIAQGADVLREPCR